MATEKSVIAVIRAPRPFFRNNSDKIAFSVLASFLASGYVLIATGAPAFSDNALISSITGNSNSHFNLFHLILIFILIVYYKLV